MAMELGIQFWGGSSKVTVSESTSQSIITDVKSTEQADITKRYKMKCEPDENEPLAGAGLYQWVVSTGTGFDQVNAKSMNLICRTGINYREKPECPFSHCIDP